MNGHCGMIEFEVWSQKKIKIYDLNWKATKLILNFVQDSRRTIIIFIQIKHFDKVFISKNSF